MHIKPGFLLFTKMIIKKAHCLFEQSGTFKNEFKKLGIDAYDYDILNDYGETDYQIDLFEHICLGYEEKPSIFDDIKPDDIILAFFPCTYFECQSQLWFAGNNFSQKNWSIKQKCECDMERHKNLSRMYEVLNKLTILSITRDFKLVIENPYNQPHYLTMYWSVKPSIIDKDRTMNGDYFKKPTQYFFVGIEPKNNLVFEPLDHVSTKIIDHMKKGEGLSVQKQRSEIHPQYASRFIRQYLIDEPNTSGE